MCESLKALNVIEISCKKCDHKFRCVQSEARVNILICKDAYYNYTV